MAEIQGNVGPFVAADGTKIDPRLGRYADVITSDLNGRYYEKASRGEVYVATTAIAGIAPGTVISASPALALLNPANSGKNIQILKMFVAYISGSIGPTVMWWVQGQNPAALVAETTAATRASAFITGSIAAAGDVAKTYSGVSLTTVPVIIRPSTVSFATYVGGAAPIPPQFEEVAGEFVIPPGYFIGLEGVGAAGTTPLIAIGFTYALSPQ
jgi:hypothetical protein